MQKTTKKVLLISAVVALVVASVAAFQVLMVANVVGPGSCIETDGGIKFSNGGSINGTFVVGNQTFNGQFKDTCLSNTTLIEMVCGKSINPSYSNLAAALIADCKEGNSSAIGVCFTHSSGAWCK